MDALSIGARLLLLRVRNIFQASSRQAPRLALPHAVPRWPPASSICWRANPSPPNPARAEFHCVPRLCKPRSAPTQLWQPWGAKPRGWCGLAIGLTKIDLRHQEQENERTKSNGKECGAGNSRPIPRQAAHDGHKHRTAVAQRVHGRRGARHVFGSTEQRGKSQG